mgnify:CR=1 FL=1
MRSHTTNKILVFFKALILPVAVYIMFTAISGGAFGSARGMLTIARQSVLSALVAWGMCMNM